MASPETGSGRAPKAQNAEARIDDTRIFDLFVEHLCNSPAAVTSFQGKRRNWTPIPTQALASTGLSLYDELTDCALIGKRSRHNKSEHLGLDVTVYKSPLGPIQFAAEHENSTAIKVLQYQAWKLFNVAAESRVLVGYSSRRSRSNCTSAQEIADGIREVAEKNRPGHLLLIVGNLDEKPETEDDLRAVFRQFPISAAS